MSDHSLQRDSDERPVADVKPSVNQSTLPKIDWLHLLLAVLSATLAGSQFSLPKTVPNVPPAPNVQPNVLPDKPDVKPDNKPDVNPVPIDPDPVPNTGKDRPVACITITDTSGQKIDSVCGPGQQLVLSSDHSIHGCHPDSIIWSVKPDVQKTLSRDGTSLILTTPKDYVELTIQQSVALADKVATATVELKSGTPNVNPTPNPQPGPGPTPLPGPTPTPSLPVGEFGGLPSAIWALAGQVTSTNRAAEAGRLADAFESLAAQVAAGAIKTAPEIVAAVGSQFNAVSTPAWDAAFRVKSVAKMRQLYTDGQLATPDKWQAMLKEAAVGLRAVTN